MVQQLGQVVTDPAKFRKAGVDTSGGFVGRIFPSAANRLDLIVQTETMRAHNQGRIGFYKHAGVKKVRWLTAEDDRVCPVCGPLSEKVFTFDDAPNIPAHPACRCTVVAEIEDEDVEDGAISTPEDYGVDVLSSEDSSSPYKKYLPPLKTDAVPFPHSTSGATYRTNALAGTEQGREAQRRIDFVASEMKRMGVVVPSPSGGIEFRKDGIGKGYFLGKYNVGEDRILVMLKNRNGAGWRSAEKIRDTLLEEIGHAKSFQAGWFSKTNAAFQGDLVSPDVRGAVQYLMTVPPDADVANALFDDWVSAKNYPQNQHEVELVGKMYRRAKLNPEAVKKYSQKVFHVLASLA